MNTLQDAREARQMWEYKFANAGREGITPRIGKGKSFASLLGRILHTSTAKAAKSGIKLRENYQPV